MPIGPAREILSQSSMRGGRKGSTTQVCWREPEIGPSHSLAASATRRGDLVPELPDFGAGIVLYLDVVVEADNVTPKPEKCLISTVELSLRFRTKLRTDRQLC
jgi:hypothetical protein